MTSNNLPFETPKRCLINFSLGGPLRSSPIYLEIDQMLGERGKTGEVDENQGRREMDSDLSLKTTQQHAFDAIGSIDLTEI